MYLIKVSKDTTVVLNKVCTAIMIFYAHYELNVINSIIEVPMQGEFFNVLPLLEKLKQYIITDKINPVIKKEKNNIITIDFNEEKTTDYQTSFITLKKDNQAILNNKEFNACAVLGIEYTKANHMKPFIQIVGNNLYQDYSFIYTVIQYLLKKHGYTLSNMNLNLASLLTKSSDDLINEL